MAGHDVGSDAVPIWAQFIAGLMFLGLTAAQIWKFLKEWNQEPARPSHAILEQADLADLQPMRDLVKRLDTAFPLFEGLDQKSDAMLKILRDQEREATIAKEVEDRLREERMEADRVARNRERGGRE